MDTDMVTTIYNLSLCTPLRSKEMNCFELLTLVFNFEYGQFQNQFRVGAYTQGLKVLESPVHIEW